MQSLTAARKLLLILEIDDATNIVLRMVWVLAVTVRSLRPQWLATQVYEGGAVRLNTSVATIYD